MDYLLYRIFYKVHHDYELNDIERSEIEQHTYEVEKSISASEYQDMIKHSKLGAYAHVHFSKLYTRKSDGRYYTTTTTDGKKIILDIVAKELEDDVLAPRRAIAYEKLMRFDDSGRFHTSLLRQGWDLVINGLAKAIRDAKDESTISQVEEIFTQVMIGRYTIDPDKIDLKKIAQQIGVDIEKPMPSLKDYFDMAWRGTLPPQPPINKDHPLLRQCRSKK